MKGRKNCFVTAFRSLEHLQQGTFAPVNDYTRRGATSNLPIRRMCGTIFMAILLMVSLCGIPGPAHAIFRVVYTKTLLDSMHIPYGTIPFVIDSRFRIEHHIWLKMIRENNCWHLTCNEALSDSLYNADADRSKTYSLKGSDSVRNVWLKILSPHNRIRRILVFSWNEGNCAYLIPGRKGRPSGAVGALIDLKGVDSSGAYSFIDYGGMDTKAFNVLRVIEDEFIASCIYLYVDEPCKRCNDTVRGPETDLVNFFARQMNLAERLVRGKYDSENDQLISVFRETSGKTYQVAIKNASMLPVTPDNIWTVIGSASAGSFHDAGPESEFW
jgi:hypothetical protein